MPSGIKVGWTVGSSNSDTDRVTAVFRGTTATPIVDAVQWNPFGPLAQYNQQNTSSTLPLRTRVEDLHGFGQLFAQA